ncbi:nitrilase-related carbon-nitrogen hydrolase [Mycobacteroides immunogenum]|uniref:nitrilase-related carbon-nitrogen hydrolase n=1 Tax=Mycobacteroides immunogenum TaxID=83262 RepID=UPI0025B7824A|nr:nitrilase-related carbon-nitrogen hydrolase [Mycobacteroides immunogenum]WJR36136.1 nitrilase-related carbon-nitrogen hydrolase [Mycobacteroides immunogenum]
MITPYTAVGLSPVVRDIQERADIERNLDHIEVVTQTALGLANLDIPVRLLAIPEGALQGFGDESHDADHAEYAHTCAIDIPGPETDRLAQLAKANNIYILAQAKARHKDWRDLFFNVGFAISPVGDIVLKHYKISALLPSERSVSPHDLYDWWIEKYGRTLTAFWPVADTDIGRIGVMMAMEGNYPENGRGLAMNGAEIVYRASMPTPFTGNDIFEISNRARALENNFYVVAPNVGASFSRPSDSVGIDNGGGRSMIVDYRGAVVGKQFDSRGSTFVTGVIDIEALRYQRMHAQTTNWLKDVRTEIAQLIYENPIYPKNLYLNRVPGHHAEYRQVIEGQISLMQDRDIWRRPSYEQQKHS